MTNKLAARYTVALSTLFDRLEDDERGASAMEYVGMLLVGGVVVAAIAAAVNTGSVGPKVSEAVQKIFSPA